MEDFDIALQKHLNKCELEFRKKNLPNGSNVEWLIPHCDNVQEIAKFLRYLGFKIQKIVDEEDCAGEKHQWVETTDGIIIYVNDKFSQGFMAPAYKKEG